MPLDREAPVELTFCIQERTGAYLSLLRCLASMPRYEPTVTEPTPHYSWISASAGDVFFSAHLGMSLSNLPIEFDAPARLAVVLGSDAAYTQVGDLLKHAQLRDVANWRALVTHNPVTTRKELETCESNCACPQIRRCPITAAKRWFTNSTFRPTQVESQQIIDRFYHPQLEHALKKGSQISTEHTPPLVDQAAHAEVDLFVESLPDENKLYRTGGLYHSLAALALLSPPECNPEPMSRWALNLVACFTEQCDHPGYSYDKAFGHVVPANPKFDRPPLDLLVIAPSTGHGDWKSYAKTLAKFLTNNRIYKGRYECWTATFKDSAPQQREFIVVARTHETPTRLLERYVGQVKDRGTIAGALFHARDVCPLKRMES